MTRTTTLLAALCIALLLTGASQASSAAAKAALKRVLPEIKFTNVALKDCFEFLRDVSGANLNVNWKALEAVGVSRETQINVRLRAVSMSKVLSVLLNESGATAALTYFVEDGVIEVTTKAISDQKLITKVYPVQDLLIDVPDFEYSQSFGSGGYGGYGGGYGGYGGGGWGGGWGGAAGPGWGGQDGRRTDGRTDGRGWDGSGSSGSSGSSGASGVTAKSSGKTKQERGEDLVTLIMELIQPEIWRQNGGPAAIRFFNGNLIVTAPRSVHEMIGGPVD